MYYNIRQVANILGVKVRTIREWIRNGKIHGEKNEISGRWYFTEEEVARLVEVYRK